MLKAKDNFLLRRKTVRDLRSFNQGNRCRQVVSYARWPYSVRSNRRRGTSKSEIDVPKNPTVGGRRKKSEVKLIPSSSTNLSLHNVDSQPEYKLRIWHFLVELRSYGLCNASSDFNVRVFVVN